MDLVTFYSCLIRGTGWTIGVLGFGSRRGLGIFLFTTVSGTALGPHPASYPMDTKGSFFGDKATGA